MQITKSPSGKTPLIFDHQRSAFEKLRRAGNVCFSPLRKNLPMQARTNSLLIGPSGSGKSYLARAVAQSFGLECKNLTVAEWMVLGSGTKGAKRSWNSIFDFLVKNHSKKGAVIFLDEIDKLDGTGDWSQHLRVEVFRLLDLTIPPDLLDEDDHTTDPTLFREVSEFLKHRTFIIAAGAFQSLWDDGSKKVGGFGGDQETEPPSQEILSRYLAKELINRFRSDVVILEQLTIADYESMLLSSAEKMPPQFQERFLLLGEQRIAEARRNHQGVRFLEELTADVLAEDIEPAAPEVPQKKTPRWRLDSCPTRFPWVPEVTPAAF